MPTSLDMSIRSSISGGYDDGHRWRAANDSARDFEDAYTTQRILEAVMISAAEQQPVKLQK